MAPRSIVFDSRRSVSRRSVLASLVAAAGPLVVPAASAPAAAEEVGGTAETSDTMGGALAHGDFDDDGFQDLAIGVPGEDDFSGAVTVLYGSRTGLALAGNQTWTQDSAGAGGIKETAQPGDSFGSAVAAGDIDGDGFDDLAIAAPNDDVGGVARAGVVHVILGSSGGLTAAANQLWTQGRAAIADAAEDGDRFGTALEIADLGKSWPADLAVGVAGEARPTDLAGCICLNVGVVHVIYGSAGGLRAGGSQLWWQDRKGVPGRAELGDQFGVTLAAGNLGRGPTADLVVGVHAESAGFARPRDTRTKHQGAVHVIYGSATGLRADHARLLDQDSRGAPGKTERADFFGQALAVGDVGRGRHADLAVGTPREKVTGAKDAGAVTVFHGAPHGVASRGSQQWTQATGGVPGVLGGDHRFGASLAARDLGQSGQADLTVGLPGECNAFDSLGHRGAVVVVYGSDRGLRARGSQLWDQDSPGVPGAAEADDCFGLAVSAADVGRSRHADVAVGVPSEDVGPTDGAVADAGGVAVMHGARQGLHGAGGQFWTQQPPASARAGSVR